MIVGDGTPGFIARSGEWGQEERGVGARHVEVKQEVRVTR